MKYTWETDEDAELWFRDEFDTIEDCILDAKENYCICPGETIYVGEIVPWEPYVDAYSVLEDLESEACDECGEIAESWSTFNSKDKKDMEAVDSLSNKLTNVIIAWLKENHKMPDFNKIENIIAVEVK